MAFFWFSVSFERGINSKYGTELPQNDQEGDKQEKSNLNVEQPEPKGGMAGMYNFIQRKMKYPEDARLNKIEGKVYVGFIVDEEGKIPSENIKIEKGLYPSLDEEAMRLVSILPKWKPGKDINGDPVKVRMIISIIFKL